jgi:hypothetical protein
MSTLDWESEPGSDVEGEGADLFDDHDDEDDDAEIFDEDDE